MNTDTPFFDFLRQRKRTWSGNPQAVLSQGEVTEANAFLAAWRAAAADGVTAIEQPRPSQNLGKRISPDWIPVMHDFEGCRLQAYPDPGSRDGKPWTIGRGATGPGIGPGVTWTQQQADDRFLADLAKFEDGVSRLLGTAPTSQVQFDALVSLAYNIGLDDDADTIAEGLGDSTLLKKHKAGDFEGAARSFISWRFNDGREVDGLKKRRLREARRYQGEG